MFRTRVWGERRWRRGRLCEVGLAVGDHDPWAGDDDPEGFYDPKVEGDDSEGFHVPWVEDDDA